MVIIDQDNVIGLECKQEAAAASVTSFIKFKSKHAKFFTSSLYINSTTLEIQHVETQRSFCCRVLFWESCSSGNDCVSSNDTMQYLSQSERRLSVKFSDDMRYLLEI